MTTTTTRHEVPTTTAPRRLAAMKTGLGLTVLATAAPLLDLVTTHTLEDHVRDAYPGWSQSEVDQDRTAIAVFLVSIGVLGLIGWAVSLWGASRGKRWTRGVATTLWALATTTALFGFSPAGTYDTMLPVGIATLALLPCAAGMVAVVQLWRHPRLR